MGFPTKKKSWGLFNPASKEPYKISRTKIELFMQCKRCFYLDGRIGIPRPKGPPFALNSAVDALMKKEFDLHRAKQTAHPLMKVYGIEAVPFDHPRMEEWRDSLKRGVSTIHKPTNLFVRGGVDDVWVNTHGELIIVDYKATSKEGNITLDDEWKIQYKRQMEIYQWLFRQNGFNVSPIGYFVYVNGKTDRKAFDGRLEFDVAVIPYEGDDSWIEEVLHDLKACLLDDSIPNASPDCEFCTYYDLVAEQTRGMETKKVDETTLEKPKTKRRAVRKLGVRSKPSDSNQNLFR